METRANYIAVGFFTLVALVSVFVLIYWVGQIGDDMDVVPIDIRIQGSVSGLGPGSIVQFNGITVGKVKGLSLDATDPRFVIVHAAVNKVTPVRSDTRANIGIRGLSGGAFVLLEGGSPAAPSLLQNLSPGGKIPQIQGDPSILSDLLVRINGIAVRTERVMDTLEKFVITNSQTVSQTLENAEKFSKSLAANSDGVAKFMNSAGDVAVSLGQLSGKLDGSLTQVEEILQAVDPQTVSRTVSNVETFSQTLVDQRTQITALINTVTNAANQLHGFSGSLNATLLKVDGVVASIPADKLASAIANLDKTAQRTATLLETIDRQSLKTTIEDVAATAAGTRKLLEGVEPTAMGEMIADLGQASKQLNSVLAAIEPEKLATVINNIDKTTSKTNELLASVNSENIQQVVNDIGVAATGARNLVSGIDQEAVKTLITDLGAASKNIAELVNAIDATKVNIAVDNIADAARGAQTIISDVGKVTAPFAGRTEDVNGIIDDVSQLASRLNETSIKVDAIVNRFDQLIGAGSADGLVAEARSTLEQFRRTARSLDTQVSRVAANVSSFTRRGLGDTQNLIRDARQSLNGIQRVIRNLQDNPSSLLTGSGGNRVRETAGQRPRR